MKLRSDNSFEQWVDRFLVDANIPGLGIAIIQSGRVTYTLFRGFVCCGGPRTVTEATLFQVGCLGKPVTAAAVLCLHEQGKLHLDDPLLRYVPLEDVVEKPATLSQIRFRHLLAHTSGLPRGRFNETAQPLDAPFRELQSVRLVHVPDEGFKFSNLGYALCAPVIEKVTGEPFRECLQAKVFETDRPAGLSFSESLSNERSAGGYSRGEYYAMVHRDDVLQPSPQFPLSEGAGGFYATVPEYANFLGRALSDDHPQALGRSVRRHLETGLGFQCKTVGTRRLLEQSGSNSGYSSAVIADPSTGTGAVAMCNRANAYWDLRKVMDRALAAQVEHWPSSRFLTNSSFEGTYRSEDRKLCVEQIDEVLWASINQERFALRRRGSRSFVPEGGPFREYVLRFLLKNGRAAACYAGPDFFVAGDYTLSEKVSTETIRPGLEGRYVCGTFASAEIFCRRGRLYFLCSPIHESEMLVLDDETFLMKSGPFEKERLVATRWDNGSVAGFEVGGMTFERTQDKAVRPHTTGV